MTDLCESSNQSIGQLYAHVSRLYNSGFTALTTTIFGWLAYLGVFITILKYGLTISEYIGFTLIGLIIAPLILYFHYRLILFGRWMEQIEEDLCLDLYKYNNIPRLKYLPDINQEPFSKMPKFTIGEFVAFVFLTFLILTGFTIIVILWWGFYIITFIDIPLFIFLLWLYYNVFLAKLPAYQSLKSRISTKKSITRKYFEATG